MPKRWPLYLLYALMVLLLFVQAPLRIATGWHQLLEVSIVGGALGLMAWWTRRNAPVLEEEALRRSVMERARERQVRLTAVQCAYLVAQERRTQEHRYGNN
jgi:hypothetical protein